MLRSTGRAATIIALCSAIGLHWVALQSVAWTTMLIEYSKHAALAKAVAQTFDGAHPCSLCHAVAKGKSSETRSDLQPTTSKIDMICWPRAIQLLPSFILFDYASITFSSSDRGRSPPVPPPRSFLS